MRSQDVPEIDGYCSMVEEGRVPACEEQRLLVAYVRRAFDEEELYVDRRRLALCMSYERYFPFTLSPEQRFLTALWLCTYDADGRPRWRDLFLYVTRGWGKTAFGAFLAFCMISPAVGIPKYDVDICATVETQAKIGYDELWNIFESDPAMYGTRFTWNKTEAYSKDTRSRVKYWSGNSGSKDGMQSGCVWFDEEHAYESSESMAVFTGGLGKKPEPRRLITTTDGFVRDGPLDETKERCEQILREGEPDNGTLPFMCRLDSMDEIGDEGAWPKANPRLLRSADLLAEYRSEVAEWSLHPARHPEVPTKRFNIPQERTAMAVTSWDNICACSKDFDMGEVRGRSCVAGIDYAKTTDMVGACLLFKVGEGWRAVAHGWWCTRSADAGEVKAPLSEWAEKGLLTVTDAVEVSPQEVAAWIRETAGSLGAAVECVAIDSYRFTLMRRALKEAGWNPEGDAAHKQVWTTRPSDVMRVQPVIDSAFANRSLLFGDNPLMRWAINNAKLEPAANNCLTYGKVEPHGRKTDPFMALVHAFCVAERIREYAPVAFMAPMIL